MKNIIIHDFENIRKISYNYAKDTRFTLSIAFLDKSEITE